MILDEFQELLNLSNYRKFFGTEKFFLIIRNNKKIKLAKNQMKKSNFSIEFSN
jgi:hypothetical protein